MVGYILEYFIFFVDDGAPNVAVPRVANLLPHPLDGPEFIFFEFMRLELTYLTSMKILIAPITT